MTHTCPEITPNLSEGAWNASFAVCKEATFPFHLAFTFDGLGAFLRTNLSSQCVTETFLGLILLFSEVILLSSSMKASWERNFSWFLI